MKITLEKRDGEVKLEKPLDYLFSLLRNGVYTLEIKRKSKPRSPNQNALMWLWFACLEQSTGQSKDDFHGYYCLKFLKKRVEVCGRSLEVPGKTSELSTEQFTYFLNQVQADAATEFGVRLPLPEDRFFEEFIDEYQKFI